MISKLKPFVNDPLLWKAFQDYCDEELAVTHKTLERLNEPSAIYREQGKAEVYNKLKKLRDKVNGPDTTESLFK